MGILKSIVLVIICGYVSSLNKIQEQKCSQVIDLMRQTGKKLTTQYEQGHLDKIFSTVVRVHEISKKIVEHCQFNVQEIDKSPQSCIQHLDQLYSSLKYVTSNKEVNMVIMGPDFVGNIHYMLKSCTSYDIYPHGKKDQSPDGLQYDCLICGGLVTIVEKFTKATLKRVDSINFSDFCNQIPDILNPTCRKTFEILRPLMINGFERGETSDLICASAGFCIGNLRSCQMHPDRLTQNPTLDSLRQSLGEEIAQIPPYRWISDLISHKNDDFKALIDIDEDGFSDEPLYRGWHFFGQDCDQFEKNIYPGRKERFGKPGVDYNCNGIRGFDEMSKREWKDIMCNDTRQMGLIVLGDESTTNFGLPYQYLIPQDWKIDTFIDLWWLIHDDGFSPLKSQYTGFSPETDFKSFYKKMVNHNRCNRNDYQNYAVSRANTQNYQSIIEGLKRNSTLDNPVMVIFQLGLNDICNQEAQNTNATDLKDFQSKVLGMWKSLDKILPKGSHMVVSGFYDGSIFYQNLAPKQHAVDSNYSNLYQYLNCLDSNPCWIWMNDNSTLRDQAASYARRLNMVYEDLIANFTFTNFDVMFFDRVVAEQTIVANLEDLGYDLGDLNEKSDGFQPSQIYKDFNVDRMWNTIMEEKPEWFGQPNPNNQKIDQMFPEKRTPFTFNLNFKVEM